MPLKSILPWSRCSTLEKKHPMWHKQTKKPTPGGIGCIRSPVFPTCQFRFLAADYKGAAGAKQCAFANHQTNNTKSKQNSFFSLLPICQMLFTGWRLNPREANTNMFLLSKNTVNWKDGRPCLHFQHRIAKEPRHRGIFGDFRIRRVQQYKTTI